MNELKPEDVMRALECFHNRILNTDLAAKITEQEMMAVICAIALLREKDARIAELEAENQEVHSNWQKLKKSFDEASEEFLDYQADVQMEIAYARAEAITEFAERLKSCEFFEIADQYDGMQYVDFCDWVYQIAEELKGANNGESNS